jgi:2,4-diketo-3-deoxy-L-fuconate hydrolase
MATSQPFGLGTFSAAGCAPFPGLVIDERVIALHALARYLEQHGVMLGAATTMMDVLHAWPRVFAALERTVHALSAGQLAELSLHFVPVQQLRVHAPIPAPGTVYCSGANYRKHVVDLIIAHQNQAETQAMTLEQKREWGMQLMDRRAQHGTPFIFVKPQSSVTGPFDDIAVPDVGSKPDWELELAVVIGRKARGVSRESALDYVAGYTIANDITLREKVFRRKTDSPELGMDFVVSKGAPGFLPLGPYLIPAPFIPDPQRLHVTLKVNGRTMQDEETSDMIFSVARIIEYLSADVELQPGDIICTGSPAGNGMHYGRFIQDGDVLEGSITGLGQLRNRCVLDVRRDADIGVAGRS